MPLIAGLVVGIAFVTVFSLVVIAPYMSSVPASDVTFDNPYGVDAQVFFTQADSRVSCPLRPCDTSGFVLKVVSREDAMLPGYEVCNIISTCVHSEDMEAHLLGTSED